ncbi:MAG TPA: DNA polymerase III subunit beta [Devosia sp.]|nr:DNA polymerase III subunit beta [Devosia sp.]
MTIEVQPADFKQGLDRVMGAVERNKENPVVGHILLTTGGGQCTMRATDYVVEITTAVECQGEMRPVVVPADRLGDAFTRLADRGIARFALDGDKLLITSGRSKFTLPLLEPAENFPTIARADVGTTFVVDGRALSDLFETCAFAIPSKDSRRPILEGLHLFGGDIRHFWPGHIQARPKLCAVATDSYKMMAREISADLPSDMPGIVLPKSSVGKLGRMIREWSEVHVEITSERLIASFGPTRFVTKLLEGSYPDWWRAIPLVEPVISYDSDELAAAIGTTYAAVRADKRYGALTVTFDAEESAFDIRNADGTAAGSDACHHSIIGDAVPSFAIGFNPEYFIEVIEHFGAETLQLSVIAEDKPTLLTCPNLLDRMALLMPMRIGVIQGSD